VRDQLIANVHRVVDATVHVGPATVPATSRSRWPSSSSAAPRTRIRPSSLERST
jgi:hypothetical protein